MIMVTGGAGFIGSNFVLDWLQQSDESVVNLDKLTYAGSLENLQAVADEPRHVFVHGDIEDLELVASLLERHRPRAIIHLAAESHVDRSIHEPGTFARTNVMGTLTLLDAAYAYWAELPEPDRSGFRFIHVSTDEVYGSLDADSRPSIEIDPYAPNSPYAASKASSDHFARAYHRTYGLPVITTHSSNNYGPLQAPEKLIPLMIVNAISGLGLPVYGDGEQVRDWIHVADHCAALRAVLERGSVGGSYNIGAAEGRKNIDVVRGVCELLDELAPRADGAPHARGIEYVRDRPGHDVRYALDTTKIEKELGWRANESFNAGLRKTVTWYLDNLNWVRKRTQTEAHRDWLEKHYELGSEA
jgi:dTDP-glucose 4,6-dehydratase